MKQRTFFDDEHREDMRAKRESKAKPKTNQQREVRRVKNNLADGIRDYRKSFKVGDTFNLDAMEAFLRALGLKFRGDSSRKILSVLKTDGELDYEVLGNNGERKWTK